MCVKTLARFGAAFMLVVILISTAAESWAQEVNCDVPSYLDAMSAQAGDLTAAGDRLVTISEDPRVLQPSWRRGIQAELASWGGLLEAAEALCAPPELAHVQETYVAGMERMVAAAERLIDALEIVDVSLDTGNMGLMQQAIPLVEQSLAEVEQAGAIFQIVKQQLTEFGESQRGR